LGRGELAEIQARLPAHLAQQSGALKVTHPNALAEALETCPSRSAINYARAEYLANDGLVYPVVQWFDRDGESCLASDAKAAVAGHEGRWFAIDLSKFEEATNAS
jgi:hypothetical protein